MRGDRVAYLRALDDGTLGLIETSENGGQDGAPRPLDPAYADACGAPLLAVMRAFDDVRDALIAAIEAVPEDTEGTWRPALIDGISGLGKHEDFDLENADDVQLASYSRNRLGYRLHRDTMDENTPFPARLLTIIFYLNADYRDEDGGLLRLFLGRPAFDLTGPSKRSSPGADDPCVDIAPLLDRVVIFRSSSFHEVAPSAAPRLAITQWLAGRPRRRRTWF